jgi:peptidoglycan/LPS O-acetylase OafA/YrhL
MGRPMPTLGEQYRCKENSIGALRLFAASMVIVGHAISFGRYAQDWTQRITNNQVATGRWPVDLFFVLSGFLLVASFEKTSLSDFARNRILRIYPAYLVCIILTGLFVPPIFNLPPNFHYIWRSAPLIAGAAGFIPGLFTNNFDKYVNSALWTLPIELWCYISIPFFGYFGLLTKKLCIALFGIILASYWFLILHSNGPDNSAISSPLRLASFFYAGVCFHIYRDRILLSGKLALAAAAALALLTAIGTKFFHHSGGLFYLFAPILFSYVVIYAAIRLPFTKLNSKTDLSYGIYIYGTLILQILAAFGLASGGLSYIAYLALAAAITLCLATASWHFIERPALVLKRKTMHPISPAIQQPG